MLAYELLKGAIAGGVATAPMTLAMEGMAQFLPQQEDFDLPPNKVTAQTASRAGIRERPNQETKSTLTYLAHFGYGAAAGALYAPVATRIPVPPLLSGVAYGLGVWAASYVGALPAMDIMGPPEQQPRSRNAQLILSHVVWGASLGFLVDQLNS
jgi:uncharacterized membrane protein YagU involved in acid resistance